MELRPLEATDDVHRSAAAIGVRTSAAVESRPEAARTRETQCRAVVVAAVVYTVVVTLLATWRGPGISPDSVAYASAANSLAETGALTMFDGGYLRFFPPGLPLVLAGLLLLGVPLGVAAIALNCLAASGTVVVTERIAHRATGSPVLAAACAVILAVSMGFVSVNAMLWTEPIVGLTTAVWILLLQRLQANAGLTRADGIALVLVISLSCTFGYAALFMIPVTAVSVAVVYWRRGRRRALGSSVLLAVAATIGLAVDVGVNARHGIEPLGQRAPSTLNGIDVGWQVLASLGALLVNSDEAPLVLLGVAGTAVVAALAVLLARAHRARSWRPPPRASLSSPLTPLVLAASAYGVFLVASELTTAINQIGYRLLYPILSALVVLGVVAVRALLLGSRRPLVRRLWQMRLAFFATYITALACSGIGWSVAAADRGLGYNQVGLRHDPWIPVVRQLPSDTGLISNNPYAVRWLTGRQPVHPSFGLTFYADADTDVRAGYLCSLVNDDTDTYLLWLGDGAAKGVRDFATLGFATTPVSSGADYSLFDVTGCLRPVY